MTIYWYVAILQYTRNTCGTVYRYIAEVNNYVKQIVWTRTGILECDFSHCGSQAHGSEVEKMAAWSSCIVPNRTLKSILWEQFGSPSSDNRTVANRDVAICRICKVEMLFENNTTSVFTHLECHHKDVHSSSKGTSSQFTFIAVKAEYSSRER